MASLATAVRAPAATCAKSPSPAKACRAAPLPANRPRAFGSPRLAVPKPARRAERGACAPRAMAQSTAVSVDELNKQFGIPGYVEVKAGRGGLPTVVLTHPCGASAEVTLFGACITSWKQPSGDEVLYIRPDAVFDKSKPISGGVPHCFPQFGPGKMQQHGFARNLDWAIGATSADPQPDERDPEVQLVLTDNEYTRAMWPHAFKAVFSVALHGDLLRTDFRVVNTGDSAFDFTAALHTYLEVLDVEKAGVKGLKGLEYLDKTVDANNPAKKKEDREVIKFEGPVDSVYLAAPDYTQLDVGTGAGVGITTNNWGDVVVWSPWTAMPDCYKSFVCVESARVSKPVVLQPREFWRAQMEMAVVDL